MDKRRTAKQLPIEWVEPGGMPAPLATNVVVQHGEHGVFTLSFYEVRPPLLMGTEEEKAAALERIESVPAICVGRVSVPAAEMGSVIRVLSENLRAFEASTQRGES